MFTGRRESDPTRSKRSPAAGVKKRRKRTPPVIVSGMHPIPPYPALGEVRTVPCRQCAINTGVCHSVEMDEDGDGQCYGCVESGVECEGLPAEAIENGKALTAAMEFRADRFTTRLLSRTLCDHLRSLDAKEAEVNAQDAKKANAEQVKKRMNRVRLEEVGDRSHLDRDGDYYESDENGVDYGEGDGTESVNSEKDTQAMADSPNDNIEARRARVMELLGEVVNLLVR